MGKALSPLPGTWSEMTLQQRRQWRQESFVNPKGIPFVSPEAQAAYRIRAQRLVDSFNLVEPDRVPIMTPVGNLPYYQYGITMHTAINDIETALKACDRFNAKFSKALECYVAPKVIPAPVFDILDYKLYTWPGHGLEKNAPGFQFVEGEYMTAAEYDDLIRDPSDFWLRTFLPRIFGAFEVFGSMAPLTDLVEIPTQQLSILGNPKIRQTLRKLIEAGDEFERRSQAIAASGNNGPANGFPAGRGGFAKAPFDILGDTLRGTKGIMMDMYRMPDKLLAAIDAVTDISIHSLVSAALRSPMARVTFPLHKGADGWMSQQQFKKFYWPSLRKVVNALIEQGVTVVLFAEGSYQNRLPYVNDFPKGTVCWWFDQTDMQAAHKLLGDNCSLIGNVPASLLVTGQPKQVKALCRGLIETCAPGGGYILGAGCHPDNPKLENLYAMIEAISDYGVY